MYGVRTYNVNSYYVLYASESEVRMDNSKYFYLLSVLNICHRGVKSKMVIHFNTLY